MEGLLFGQGVARQRREPRGSCGGAPPSGGGNLFARIGAFLVAQGLSPDPANYALAHALLGRTDAAAREAVARLEVDGVRLSRRELETLGGGAVAARPAPSDPRCDEEAIEKLVAQTRGQVDAMADTMRAIHDETRGFGRDLAQSAAAFETRAAAPSAAEIVRLTRAMIARAADAEARLADAASETDALRVALAEAEACARADPLTGLPNRRAFEEGYAGLKGAAGCLALVDIDRFKRINDGFGHDVGDRVLGAVATLLARECAGHLVSRLGGEEFAILLAGVEPVAAGQLLDAARTAVGARHFRTRDTDASIGRVTFSAGIVATRAGESAEAALARADRLLYRAKEDGRDRVVAG